MAQIELPHVFARCPKVFTPATSVPDAISAVEVLLRQQNCILVEPGAHHLQQLLRQMTEAQLSGPETTDAIFAALAMENNATTVTVDRSFRRLPKLKLLDPTR